MNNSQPVKYKHSALKSILKQVLVLALIPGLSGALSNYPDTPDTSKNTSTNSNYSSAIKINNKDPRTPQAVSLYGGPAAAVTLAGIYILYSALLAVKITQFVSTYLTKDNFVASDALGTTDDQKQKFDDLIQAFEKEDMLKKAAAAGYENPQNVASNAAVAIKNAQWKWWQVNGWGYLKRMSENNWDIWTSSDVDTIIQQYLFIAAYSFNARAKKQGLDKEWIRRSIITSAENTCDYLALKNADYGSKCSDIIFSAAYNGFLELLIAMKGSAEQTTNSTNSVLSSTNATNQNSDNPELTLINQQISNMLSSGLKVTIAEIQNILGNAQLSQDNANKIATYFDLRRIGSLDRTPKSGQKV